MILPDKDNFARSGIKTSIKLSFENAFSSSQVFSSSYLNSFVLIRIVHIKYDCTENICFLRVLPTKSDYKLF